MKAALQEDVDRDAPRANRRDALIIEASKLFNGKGFAATTLEDLSDRLSLTKTGPYYYVRDKKDLLYQCYRHGCAQVADRIAEARLRGSTGLARLQHWITGQLDETRPPVAVLREVPLLNESQRAEIDDLSARNLVATRRFIKEGIEDGSIRPCDPMLVNLAITGAMAWTPVWLADGARHRMSEIGRAFADLFTHGISLDRVIPSPGAPMPTSAPAPDPKGHFNREQRARQKRDSLIRTAIHLFNQRGIVGTTIDDIVEALGVTKGTFYHYFDSKDDLLSACYARSIDLSNRCWDWAGEIGSSIPATLAQSVRCLAQAHYSDEGPLATFTGLGSLPEAQVQSLVGQGREIVRRSRRLLRDGIEQGLLRPVDATLAQQAMTGALNWLPHWGDSLAGEAVAEEFVALFLLGLKAGDQPA